MMVIFARKAFDLKKSIIKCHERKKMVIVNFKKDGIEEQKFNSSNHRFDTTCSTLAANNIEFTVLDLSKKTKKKKMRIQCIPITQMGTSNYTICILPQNESLDLHKAASVIHSPYVQDYIWESEYTKFVCDSGELTPLLQNSCIRIAIDVFFSSREKTKEMIVLVPTGKKNMLLEMKLSDMISFLEKEKRHIFYGDIKKRS